MGKAGARRGVADAEGVEAVSVCETCGVDPAVRIPHGDGTFTSGHDCHCVREDGVRVAVGICCGREVGADGLAAEEAREARRLARGEVFALRVKA